MAFEAKNFVLCSKFNLFKAHCNLWIYITGDTLEDCLATNYFRPRENLKNQDSPEIGDVIQLVVEHSKLAYLKIVGKTERPYNITVARTYLENEATLLALITALQLDKAAKVEDFVSAITDENKGLTQVEQAELEQKIDLAANSGRMITAQGFWYAKMYAATVAPSAENGTNYVDFSQVDGQGNPIIVTYNRVNGAWVQDQTITPPADFDGYVPITSKIWDISEQDGQQGGRILWNHTSKEFTPYPQIVSFDSIEITGDSTVDMPAIPTDDNIVNVGFVKNTIGTARNIGDIFFTARTDSALNGAVECDGDTYNTTDFIGAQSIGNLLSLAKLPYVSLATYATLLSTNGSVGVFGWDGVGNTAFRVPSLNDVYVETGAAAQLGDIVSGVEKSYEPDWANKTSISSGATISANGFVTGGRSVGDDLSMSIAVNGLNVATFSSNHSGTVYMMAPVSKGDTVTLGLGTYYFVPCKNTKNVVRYRAMIQLAVSATDEAVETCTAITAQVASNTSAINGADYVIESQLPTALNNYTWYRKYKSGWVEQGGGVSTHNDTTVTINLPVTMSDANYCVNKCNITATSTTLQNISARTFAVSNRTTTGFDTFANSIVDGGFTWQVSGMAAQ